MKEVKEGRLFLEGKRRCYLRFLVLRKLVKSLPFLDLENPESVEHSMRLYRKIFRKSEVKNAYETEKSSIDGKKNKKNIHSDIKAYVTFTSFPVHLLHYFFHSTAHSFSSWPLHCWHS